MPIYDLACECGHEAKDVYQTMSGVDHCPMCFQVMRRVPTVPNTDLKEFHTPIDLYSIAMDNDDEIRKFKRKCPDVDVSMEQNDPMYGVPIARNRKQKLAALGASGFVETN